MKSDNFVFKVWCFGSLSVLLLARPLINQQSTSSKGCSTASLGQVLLFRDTYILCRIINIIISLYEKDLFNYMFSGRILRSVRGRHIFVDVVFWYMFRLCIVFYAWTVCQNEFEKAPRFWTVSEDRLLISG